MPLIFLDMIWAAPKIPLLVGDCRNYTTYSHRDRIIHELGTPVNQPVQRDDAEFKRALLIAHMILSCPFTFLMSGYGPVWLPVSSFGWLQYNILHSSGLDENYGHICSKSAMDVFISPYMD